MLRLLVMLGCVGVTLMALLQLRQQQQALGAGNLRLHREIRQLEQTLWRQQVLVGADLAPGSLEHRVGQAPLPTPHRPDATPPPAPPPEPDAWSGLFGGS